MAKSVTCQALENIFVEGEPVEALEIFSIDEDTAKMLKNIQRAVILSPEEVRLVLEAKEAKAAEQAASEKK